ncbi:MAG TPA: flagellar hook capping FlgD N-terminal domain-containing protein [Demequina sp.]|nr:flagellar hook capping FlgD N-terminal domain-containing protein [Demequina sp.]
MSIDVTPITWGSAAAAASTGTATASTAAAPGTLDKEAFLKLLVAQLRNQDPSKPMDSSELMAQTTQLSTMEQLTALTKTSQESFALQMRMAAASLVGRQVTYADESGATVTGAVTSVSYAGSVPTVTVGGKVVALDAVSSVTAPATATPAAPASSTTV